MFDPSKNRGGAWVRGGVLLLLAVGLFWLWWRHGDNARVQVPEVSWGWGLAAVALLLGMFVSYIGRTTVVLGLPLSRGPAQLLRPLLLGHAVSVLGVSVVGGLSEVVLVARRLDRPMRSVLLAMLFRMSLNMAGVGLLAAVALARFPVWAVTLGVLFALVPLAFFPALRLAGAVPSLARWLDLDAESATRPSAAVIVALLVVSTAESTLAAFALLCVGRAVGLPLDVPVALGVFALVEVASYSPFPLAALGLHHWSITGALAFLAPDLPSPSMLALSHHGLIVASGALAALAFALLPGRVSPQGETTAPRSPDRVGS